MKTYYLERYFDQAKITVDDDVNVDVRSSFDGEGKEMVVVFTKPTIKYDGETIAAFSRVNSLREENTDIQYREVEYFNDYENQNKVETKIKWIDASKKSETP
jgi:hypothetical protein